MKDRIFYLHMVVYLRLISLLPLKRHIFLSVIELNGMHITNNEDILNILAKKIKGRNSTVNSTESLQRYLTAESQQMTCACRPREIILDLTTCRVIVLDELDRLNSFAALHQLFEIVVLPNSKLIFIGA